MTKLEAEKSIKNQSKYYSMKEAAEVLGLSYFTVQRNIGDWPHIRFGQKILIPKTAIDPE